MRYPLLARSLGIGRLFQNNTRNREKQVLMVFIKTSILRNGRDNLHVTGEKYNNIREEQLTFLRSQETYISDDTQIVLDPLQKADLPKPFILVLFLYLE